MKLSEFDIESSLPKKPYVLPSHVIGSIRNENRFHVEKVLDEAAPGWAKFSSSFPKRDEKGNIYFN
jgi:hypothetical protein